MTLTPADLLVLAPHPDDEAIATGGVIQHALGAGKSVRIVFVTSGDGYPRAASALMHRPMTELTASDFVHLAGTRQMEAVAAAAILGVATSNLLFLGYPDGALADVCSNESDQPVKSPTSGMQATYGPAYTDYHTLTRGRPAPYRRSSVLADVAEVLSDSNPETVYVTDPADDHEDHSALFEVTLKAVAETAYLGRLLTFVVHSGTDASWPWPRGAAQRSLEQHTIDTTVYPKGVSWPPPVRVPVSDPQSATKLRAIAAHASQFALDREYLESFVKSEEVFWIRG